MTIAVKNPLMYCCAYDSVSTSTPEKLVINVFKMQFTINNADDEGFWFLLSRWDWATF